MAPKKAALSFLWKKEPASKDAVARKGSVARKDSTAIGAPGKTKKKITPREIWRRVKAFFQSPTGAYAGIMLSMLLFVAALGMLAMYAFEFRETLRLRLAARRVSRFMTNRDINLKKNSTREKLIAAQSYAEVLSMWTKRIKELEDEIYEIESLIVRDWDVHDNSIYYFEHKRMTFQDAVAFCATNKSFVASVEKETEEEYLEAFITTRTISFWIGLHKKGNKWVWFEDVPVTVTLLKPAGKRTKEELREPAPLPLMIEGEEHFEIVKILDSRVVKGGLEYLVQWKHFPIDMAEWVGVKHVNAERLIHEFHLAYPDKPRLGK